MSAKPAVRLISGNHACALGAVAAGCRFFAGYPITPSSEIAERLSRALPQVDGVFMQMEDEIASIAAVIGASMGGVKAMTATSGPGFSLKQENLGYAAGAEIPCVIVNVMRGGPSTGMPTRPAQGDIMQARWGSHGDYPIIVLAPASVREIYYETIRAFDLAETFRTPVVRALRPGRSRSSPRRSSSPTTPTPRTRERKWASGPREAYRPYATGDDRHSGHVAARRRLSRPHHRPDATPKTAFRARTRRPSAATSAGCSTSSSAHRDADRLLAGAALRRCRRGDRGDRHQRPRRDARRRAVPRARPARRAVPPDHAVAVPGSAPCARPRRTRARRAGAGTERRPARASKSSASSAAKRVDGHPPRQRRADHAGRNRRASASGELRSPQGNEMVRT